MAITMEEFTSNTITDHDYNVTGDGIFDDMMEAINCNIKAQYDAGRLTGSDYATVYLGAIQTAIAQATQILMNKDIVDVQVAGEQAKNRLIEKQIEEEQYKLNTLLPDEHNINIKKENQLDDELLTTAKQRDLIEAQTEEINSKKVIAENQSAKDLLLKDKQIEKINDELLTTAKQRNLIDKDIELKDTQESELKLNGIKDRLLKDKNISLITAQERELQLNGMASRAIKEKDGIVKDKQADLYVRQKTALDDSLLKDLYKEAAGGTAMVYADASITTPTHWSKLDTLANAIAHRADPSLNITS